jgi:twitching motility protein PilT
VPDSNETIHRLLETTVTADASDLHLVAGYPPTLRVHGQLRALDHPPLTSDRIADLIRVILPPTAWPRFEDTHNIDVSYAFDQTDKPVRFRVNLFRNQGQVGACLRYVPSEIPSLHWASFPKDTADRILALRNGLILFTGVTGSGKSTSMAILVRMLSARQSLRILSVEEPIEYVFPPTAGSVITQREVGVDVASFYDGLKYGLRQDPDVILVGEIRDRDTAQIALSAAETGHLIFSTVHTLDTKGAINRVVDLFPPAQQDAARSQLALTLRCAVSQHLLAPARPGEKRVLATEVLFNNFAIASAIRNGRIESITSALQTGKKEGNMTLEDSLRRLLLDGRITRETARRYASDPDSVA